MSLKYLYSLELAWNCGFRSQIRSNRARLSARKKSTYFTAKMGLFNGILQAYLAQILFIEVSCECLQSFLSLILFFLFSVTTPNLSNGKPIPNSHSDTLHLHLWFLGHKSRSSPDGLNSSSINLRNSRCM